VPAPWETFLVALSAGDNTRFCIFARRLRRRQDRRYASRPPQEQAHVRARRPMNATIYAWLGSLGGDFATVAVLLFAFVIGAAVGIERGLSTSSVGIRTCSLVAVASAAFVHVVIEKVPESNWGSAFGAVATGVGFLGAGAIVKGWGRTAIIGLGEAGTIWCVAMIGLMIGARKFVAAVVVALLVLTVNAMLRPVAAWIDRHRARSKPEDDVLDG